MSSLRRRMQRILLAPGILRAVQIAMKRLFSRRRASESAPSAASAESARWTASNLAASGSAAAGASCAAARDPVPSAELSGSDSLIICSRVPNAPAKRELVPEPAQRWEPGVVPPSQHLLPAVLLGVRAAVTERVTRRRYGP